MAGIQGIVGLTAPGGSGPVADRPSKREETRAGSGQLDRVSISPEAKDAAQAAKLAAASHDDFRHKRVEEARRNIEEGAYKLQSVVLQVAARVSQFLD